MSGMSLAKNSRIYFHKHNIKVKLPDSFLSVSRDFVNMPCISLLLTYVLLYHSEYFNKRDTLIVDAEI